MSRSSLETDYFINESQQNDDDSASGSGYWQPHTSSIDFCESNYLLSDMIVEPHNVWSSIFGLSLLGIAGIMYGNPTREWRTFLPYFILLVIGLGSACLHASLHWCFQSSDELPMIYLMICCLFAILEVDSPQNETKYPHLSKYLILISCISTVIYYMFQHLYIIFLATFNAINILAFSLHVLIARRIYNEGKDEKCSGVNKKNIDIALSFYKWHYISYILLAAPIWVLDQFHCEKLLPLYNNLPFPLTGMTLHVVWHICAGLGAHFLIQFLCACRASTLGMMCNIKFVFGVLPVVVVSPKKKEL